MTNPENAGQKQAGQSQPGELGNLAGRPRGAKSKTTLAAEALLEGEAEASRARRSRWRLRATDSGIGALENE